MPVIVVCEWEATTTNTKERRNGDEEGDGSSSASAVTTQVRRTKLRLDHGGIDLLLDSVRHKLVGNGSVTEQCAIEIFDPTLSDYISIETCYSSSEEELMQRFGKIWRVRVTPRQEQRDSEKEAFLALPGRAYTESTGYRIGNSYLQIQERPNQQDSTAFTVWDGGILLADYLQAVPEETVRGKRVLELGSGLGLAGLTAAVLGAKCVLLTDLPDVIPLLSQNAMTNRMMWQAAGCSNVTCAALDWFNPNPLPVPLDTEGNASASFPGSWDVILLADCVWTLDLVNPLIQTLKALIKQTRTAAGELQLLVSYQRRGAHAHEAFWNSIASLFDVQELNPLSYGVRLPNSKLLLLKCIPKSS